MSVQYRGKTHTLEVFLFPAASRSKRNTLRVFQFTNIAKI